jgi:hypothetical protein
MALPGVPWDSLRLRNKSSLQRASTNPKTSAMEPEPYENLSKIKPNHNETIPLPKSLQVLQEPSPLDSSFKDLPMDSLSFSSWP